MYSITCPAFACLSLLSHEMFYFLFRVLLSYSCFSQWWIVVICCVYMKLLFWWFRANSVTSGCREGEQGAETLNGHVKVWSYWWESGSCKHDHFFSPFLFLSFHLHNTRKAKISGALLLPWRSWISDCPIILACIFGEKDMDLDNEFGRFTVIDLEWLFSI